MLKALKNPPPTPPEGRRVEILSTEQVTPLIGKVFVINNLDLSSILSANSTNDASILAESP